MAAVLHLLTAGPDDLARTTMLRQVAAGDRVTLALLEGADAGSLPAGLDVRRVPEQLPYAQLLDLIFESDQVIAW